MTGFTLAKLLESLPSARASFVEPTERLPVTKVPDGRPWVEEIKLDGYRAIRAGNERGMLLF